MSANSNLPTPHAAVNILLQELFEKVKGILGSQLVAMYLEGSLANGDFDQASDIDFVVVTEGDLSAATFLALQAMHARFNQIGSGWAIQLEGSYISRHALRRHDPAHVRFPNIERGMGEALKLVDHDEPWIVHRHILRQRGITLLGPDPKTLIDPVSPDDLRRAMLPALHGWATDILHDPGKMTHRGYQSYIVLTLCRILYTLRFGDVVSKPKALRWVKGTLSENQQGLVDRAWTGRLQDGHLPPPVAEVNQTLDFIRYVLERGQQM